MITTLACFTLLLAPQSRPAQGSDAPQSEFVKDRTSSGSKGRILRREGGAKTDKSLELALEWLAQEQNEDGSWNTSEKGALAARHGTGLTGLSLLALLGDGHSGVHGEYKETVSKGLAWLLARQNKQTGQFGARTNHAFMYDHAIATLAVAEAFLLDESDALAEPLETACAFLAKGRNKNAAWRYEVPPSEGNDNDTCISAWCTLALVMCQEAGIEVEGAVFDGMEAWLVSATDDAIGRVGYSSQGSFSARIPGLNTDIPVEIGEAMTAIAMTVRSFTMRRRGDKGLWDKQTQLLLKCLPVWSEEEPLVDMYYWYFGAQAMFQVGGKPWKAWNKSMKTAITKAQLTEGDEKGSWDPVGPWCPYGGRVYSTAMMAMCLEVYYRYPRLLDQR